MQKMALQIVVTAVFAFYLVKFTDVSLTMLIPFSGGKYLDIGWLAIPLLFIAVIGTVNGVNFTDGLDGLASSVTVLVATFFTVIAVGTKSGLEPVTCAVVGALLGFLLFNVYPAKVFMGDTGSLALGGFVASTAYMLRMPEENVSLRWHRSIIILNYADGQRQESLRYFQLLLQFSV